MNDWEFINETTSINKIISPTEIEYDYFYTTKDIIDMHEVVNYISEYLYEDKQVQHRYHMTRASNKMLINEYSMLANLNHSNIEKYIKLLKIENYIVYELEYIPSIPLEEYIKNNTINYDTIIKQLFDSVKYLHNQNLTHLNIDPQTVVIRIHQPILTNMYSIWHTKERVAFGLKIEKNRLLFTSPELITNFYLELSSIEMLKASDIWSLGLILYRIKYGPLFKSQDNVVGKILSFEKIPQVAEEDANFIMLIDSMITWNWWDRKDIHSLGTHLQSKNKKIDINSHRYDIWNIMNKLLSMLHLL